MPEAQSVPARSELPSEDTWQLEDLFPDQEAWDAARRDVLSRAKAFERHRSHLGDSPQALLSALKDEDDLWLALDHVFSWAFFRHDQDTADPSGVAIVQQAQATNALVSEATSFMQPELVALPEGRIESFLDEAEELTVYRYALLEVVRRREHVLGKDVEAALAAFTPVLHAPGEIANQLSDADLRFPDVEDSEGVPHPLTHGRYPRYITSRDRELRKNTYLAMHRAYAGHSHAFGASLAANIRRAVTEARLRGYPSSLAMQLDDSALPVGIYDRLIDAVHGALPDLHRYIRWRKDYLGVQALHFYDIYPPLAEEKAESIPWTDAKALVREALRPLGDVYGSKLDELFTRRYIDWRENAGKTSGAYSAGVYGVHPYILMSYTGQREGVFTLAHEAGHAVHSMLSNERQVFRNSQYRIFLAEVASTTNEHLLMHHLLEHTEDPTERLVLLDRSIQNFLGTVFRQTYFAEFEREAHRQMAEEGSLTAEGLSHAYERLIRAYYGDGLVVDAEGTFEWARIPHFHRPFYVFQYATGYISAAALSQAILEGKDQAALRYTDLLSAGGSDDPLPILERSGVDLMHGDALRKGMGLFAALVDQIEQAG